MPDSRRNRGPHPRDRACFAAGELPRLRRAVAEHAWLLTRGYPSKASLKLVGDRHTLRERQRLAVQRCSCSDQDRDARGGRRVTLEELAGEDLAVDGYNVLLTVEAALAGGVVLAARDGAFRDLASMRGHYRKVDQTRTALELLGATLTQAGCAAVRWYLDRPISNSGRLRALMLEVAAAAGWPWSVELVASPDRLLAAASVPVATADSGVLDRGPRWVNLARCTVEARVPGTWVVDLGGASSPDEASQGPGA